MVLDGQPELLGRTAGHRRRSRSSTDLGGGQPGRRLRGRRARLRPDLELRRVVDRLRRGPRAAAARGPVAVDRLLRLRYRAAAVRRRPRPPGLRGRRRLAPDRPAGGRRPGGGGDVDGPARHPGPERPRRPPRSRPGRGPGAPRRGRLPGRRGLPDGHAADRRLPATTRRSSPSSSASSASTSHRRSWTSGRTSTGSTTDPPAMWPLSWVADYPGRNDFLGVLLGSGSDEQLRPLELARVRCRDRRGRRDRRTRPRP